MTHAGLDPVQRDAALASTPVIDVAHPRVQALARELQWPQASVREQAVHLYGAVRDGFLYDPYHIDLSIEGMCASTVIERGKGWCVPKATLLAALCRALGIPARIGLADVKNHVTTPRLRAMMDTDVFYRHGYVLIWIEGRWVKATPAFNATLCEKMRVSPLEFDGVHDSISHPFDLEGQQHMEYLTDHGGYDEVPLDEIRPVYERYYARLIAYRGGGWQQDVEQHAG